MTGLSVVTSLARSLMRTTKISTLRQASLTLPSSSQTLMAHMVVPMTQLLVFQQVEQLFPTQSLSAHPLTPAQLTALIDAVMVSTTVYLRSVTFIVTAPPRPTPLASMATLLATQRSGLITLKECHTKLATQVLTIRLVTRTSLATTLKVWETRLALTDATIYVKLNLATHARYSSTRC